MNRKNNIKINFNKKVDEIIGKFIVELKKQGMENVRKIDVLPFCFQKKYIDNMTNNNVRLNISAKMHILDCVKQEINSLLEQELKQCEENNMDKNELLSKMQESNYATEVLKIKLPTKNKQNRAEIEALERRVNEFINEFAQKVKTEDIKETDKKDLKEIKNTKKSFYEKVRLHTNNFDFFASEDAITYTAKMGHGKIEKFDNFEEYFKFNRLKNTVEEIIKDKKTSECVAINNTINGKKKLSSEDLQILNARKDVLER